jgi:hypothetical protein
MTTIALPQPRNALLDRLRTIQIGVAARGAVGAGLATQRGGAVAAVPWYLAGGAPAPYAVWQPINATNLAASYLRLAGSGGYANIDPAVVGGVAPTFSTATGWGWNGVNQYLNTGIIAVTDQTWSALVRFSDAAAKDFAVPFGSQDQAHGNVVFDVIPNSTTYGRAYENPGWLPIGGGTGQTSGVMAIAGATAYLNGSAEADSIPSGAGTNAVPIIIGARNVTGAGNLFFNGKIQAIVIWDTSTNHAAWMPAVMAAAALI